MRFVRPSSVRLYPFPLCAAFALKYHIQKKLKNKTLTTCKMETRLAGNMQGFLWGHSRSFTHIEILAGAAAAGGVRVCTVCVCLDGYVTSHQLLQPRHEPVRLLRPVFSHICGEELRCGSNTKQVKGGESRNPVGQWDRDFKVNEDAAVEPLSGPDVQQSACSTGDAAASLFGSHELWHRAVCSVRLWSQIFFFFFFLLPCMAFNTL